MDELYEADELDDLVDSADIHISLYWFTEWNRDNADSGVMVESVTITVENRATRQELKRIVLPVPPSPSLPRADVVLTFPVSATYRIKVCGQTMQGGKEGLSVSETKLFDFDNLCQDHWFSPRALIREEVCEPQK
jgi:hypothetical protein